MTSLLEEAFAKLSLKTRKVKHYRHLGKKHTAFTDGLGGFLIKNLETGEVRPFDGFTKLNKIHRLRHHR